MTHPTDPDFDHHACELAVVEAYLDAHARADSAMAITLFTPTAVVIDDGRTYRGRAEISTWLEQTSSEYTITAASTTPLVQEGERCSVTRHLEGDFPGGVVDLAYSFTTDDAAISTLTIQPA